MKMKEHFFFLLHRLGLISKNRGYTLFAPLKIPPEYTHIDMDKKQVTGVVIYQSNVYLTVKVDVKYKKEKVKGSLRDIAHIIKPFTKKHYIDMIRSEAFSIMEKGRNETR